MNFDKAVNDFFYSRATREIAAQALFQSRTKSRIVGFQLTYEANGKRYYMPSSGLTPSNFFVRIDSKTEAEIEAIIQGSPYDIYIRPLGEPATEDAHLKLPIAWYVACQVTVRGSTLLDQSEEIAAIQRGIRVEHFFRHNPASLEAWGKLLRNIASVSAENAVSEVLNRI